MTDKSNDSNNLHPEVAGDTHRLETRLAEAEAALRMADAYFRGITPDANTQTSEQMDETRSAVAESVSAAVNRNPIPGRLDIAEENTRLRAALANSDQPCAYCTLPADEWDKCKSGFPGCARMDDAMGCPELGASMQVADLEARIAELEAARDRTRQTVVDLYTERDIAIARGANMQAALEEIAQWADSFPLDVFPEPDFEEVHRVLKAAGFTLDAVAASCMRHVLKRAGGIARAALGREESGE